MDYGALRSTLVVVLFANYESLVHHLETDFPIPVERALTRRQRHLAANVLRMGERDEQMTLRTSLD